MDKVLRFQIEVIFYFFRRDTPNLSAACDPFVSRFSGKRTTVATHFKRLLIMMRTGTVRYPMCANIRLIEISFITFIVINVYLISNKLVSPPES